jgi:hypothetical protein
MVEDKPRPRRVVAVASRWALAAVRERTTGCAVFVILLAPLLVIFRPIFSGEVVESGDFITWTLPARVLWRNAFLAGQLQQWNPLSDLGVPTLLAPTPVGVFYPGNLLGLIGPPAIALQLMYLIHLFWAGLGGHLLARRLGCRPALAVLVGLSWELGYQLWMWGMGEKVLSGAWIPWASLSLVAAVRCRRWLSGTLLASAVAFAMIALAGDPFLWIHAASLGVVLAVVSSPERPLASGLVRAGKSLFISLGLAALLAAPQLVPSLTLLSETNRAGGLSREAAEAKSLNPSRLLELVAPGATGSNHDDAWCAHLYLGMTLIVAMPMAGRRRRLLGLHALAAAALVLAMGSHFPVNELVRRALPPLAYMRYPEKHILVVLSSLALLGAMGLERLVTGAVRARWLALAAVLWAVAIVVTRATQGVLPTLHAAVWGSLALAAIGLARRHPRLVWLIPVVAAVDLTVFATPKWRWIPGELVTTLPTPLNPLMGTPGRPPSRVLVDPVSNPMPPNVGWLHDVGHIGAHEASYSTTTMKLLGASDRQANAAAILDVGWWLRATGRRAGGGGTVLADLGSVELVRLRASNRLRLVGRVEVLDDAQAIAALRTLTFDPLQHATLAPSPHSRPLNVPVRGHCRHLSFDSERILLSCRSSTEALLVMSEAYAPGWTATLDGAAVPLLRADVAVRSVFVPAGEHEIELRYRTPGLTLGLTLGALGLLVATATQLWAARSRRRVRSVESAPSVPAVPTS